MMTRTPRINDAVIYHDDGAEFTATVTGNVVVEMVEASVVATVDLVYVAPALPSTSGSPASSIVETGVEYAETPGSDIRGWHWGGSNGG